MIKRLHRTSLALAIPLALTLPATHAFASSELQNLTQRVEMLEQQSGTQLSVGGVIEVEAAYMDTEDGEESDITLATVEVAIDGEISESLNTHLLFLYEEDATDPPVLDEGIITISNLADTPFYLSAGLMYVPFGNYETNLLSDPLTLELGETQQTALQLGYEGDQFYASLFIFNGETREQGDDDKIEHFGANLGYGIETDRFDFTIDLSYLNNLADSDAIQDAVTNTDNLRDTVGGYAAHAKLGMGPFTLIGEYLAASSSFDQNDITTFDGSDAKPQSWNLELGYDFSLAGKEATAAVAIQNSDEAQAFGLPEQRIAAALSVGIMENTALTLEWSQEEDYSTSDGGTGDGTDIVTAQLAVEF